LYFTIRRITRAALQGQEKPSVELTKKRRGKNKVQFEDSSEEENKISQILSVSMVSDECIDMTFYPLRVPLKHPHAKTSFPHSSPLLDLLVLSR
jgi:hypothetical protein